MVKTTKWNKDNKIVKATQVAFELEQEISRHIHEMAVKEGLTTSSQIRKLMGLSYSPPKRPRLTVSLSPDDYVDLGNKYQIDPNDTLEIKRKIMEELIEMFQKI
jgi:hypothetical protein